MFKKYQHLERFGSTEVVNIELGECLVFPKIDGTNASIWLEDGIVKAGSRTRELSSVLDNAGFHEWAVQQESFKEYFSKYPHHRLFGEWLVPHSLKTYRESAWRKFYVFDVAVDKKEEDILHDGDSAIDYLPYSTYKPFMEEFGIDYIPPICSIKNATYDQFINQLASNVFLIEDGKGSGEGIVIKNYSFRNKFNRNSFAKIVTSEFKEAHSKAMGGPELVGRKMIESEIVEKYVTSAVCEKVFSKIENESGWSSKFIPRLLNTVYYDLVREDCWEFVKEHKNPTINFSTLQHLCYRKVKEKLNHLF